MIMSKKKQAQTQAKKKQAVCDKQVNYLLSMTYRIRTNFRVRKFCCFRGQLVIHEI